MPPRLATAGSPPPALLARRIKSKVDGRMKDLVRGRYSTDRGIDLNSAKMISTDTPNFTYDDTENNFQHW